jgi:hypothetical protein
MEFIPTNPVTPGEVRVTEMKVISYGVLALLAVIILGGGYYLMNSTPKNNQNLGA